VQTSTNADRERGFGDRLRERGAALVNRAQGDFTYDSGFRAARDLFDEARVPPDALFCANDSMALGAIDAARARGVRVPDDMSIIGFDDIPMAAWQAYQLTTVRQDIDAMIALTLDQMQARIEDPATPPRLALVPGVLTIRGSVRGL
jgi:DNA-binding LacI/PurR family transcriptional regulator